MSDPASRSRRRSSSTSFRAPTCSRVFREPCTILERRAHRSRQASFRLHPAQPWAWWRASAPWTISLPIVVLESGARARLWQCHHLQAVAGYAVQRSEAASRIARSRPARGRFPGRAGLPETGQLLTRHPQIRKVSLTGEVARQGQNFSKSHYEAIGSPWQIRAGRGGQNP